jgi:hypothetical protein
VLIYLAGMEGSLSYKVLPPNGSPVFCSYFYHVRAEQVLLGMRDKPDSRVVVDSGAHTFFGSHGLVQQAHYSKSSKAQKDPEVYVKEYIAWLTKWSDRVDNFIELDLQEIYGMPTVRRWRKMFRSAGLGPKMITAVHTGDSWDTFRRLVDDSESRYVAIEGPRMGRAELPYLKYIRYCYENGCRIHGFALVHQRRLVDLPFYSVDSTVWQATIRYGLYYAWDSRAGRMHQVNANRLPDRARTLMFQNKAGLDELPRARSPEESAAKLVKAWAAVMKMQQYYTRLWEERGVHWDEVVAAHRKAHRKV